MHACDRIIDNGTIRLRKYGAFYACACRKVYGYVGTFRVKGSMSQDVSVSEESPKKEKKKKKGLRTPSFLKKKKEKKKLVEA